jgi:hypothetical protein
VDEMAKCWELRGCDAEMEAECLHSNSPDERCPSRCNFARCERSTSGVTSDPALIFDATVDRTAAIREVCLFCPFFLKNGPRLS